MKNNLVSVIVVTRNRKSELIRCIDSLTSSSYKLFEIIVVDNASSPAVAIWFPKQYPKVKLITNKMNTGAAKGRNQGIVISKGKFILFVDDDTEVDRQMMSQLVRALNSGEKVGIVQPKIYDMEKRKILQGIGCDVDLFTGRVSAVGIREEDKGQYDNIRKLQSVGCIWMVKREVIDQIGGYDEEYFIPWEDTDFSFRARRAGFRILFVPKALAWHKGRKATFINPIVDYLGIRSEDSAYRIGRNKIIFLRKNAPFLNFLVFIFMINPIYLIIHSTLIFSTARFDILKKYWIGFTSGIWYAIKYQNPILRIYQSINNLLNPLKIFFLSLEDPVCWIIEKDAESILDVGCGQGFPMKMIKARMKIRKSVGVDLFKPYVEIGKKLKIHDQYIISDVRKLRFKDRSYDTVLALQILEHLKKKEAWKVVDKIEKIAKKQIIIATPIGRMYHPIVDNNKLQLHQSAFYPVEFEKRGYKIIKFGRKELLGENGLVHKINNDLFRKAVYGISYLLNIFLYFFQPWANYHFIAYKKVPY